MKLKNVLIIALSLLVTSINSQTKVTTPKLGKNVIKVVVENETYYLTKDIGYNVVGQYNNINGDYNQTTKTNSNEPIAKLNEDGTGLWQNYGTSKVNMEWGFECEMDGTPKKNESPYGAVYRLWYKIKEQLAFVNSSNGKTTLSGDIDKWDIVQFSIHFDEKKMYILGERVKTY